MSIDASAVIEKYKTLLADQQYLTVLLEVQLEQVRAELAQLRDERTSLPDTQE